MKSPLLFATTLTVLLVAATACGTADPVADGAAPPTTEEVVTPTTEPGGVTTPTEPTEPVEPPDSSPPPTSAPVPGPTPAPTAPPTTPAEPRPAVTEDVTIDDGTYDSVGEMGDNSSVVVVGDVVEVTSLGRPFADGDQYQNTSEYVAVTVETVDTLTGEPTGEVVLAWQAFATDSDGNRTATLLLNGIRPPEVADRLVLFLDPVDAAFNDFIGGELTHQLVKLDGIAYLDGDQVTAGEVGSTAAEQLRTMTVREIRVALSA